MLLSCLPSRPPDAGWFMVPPAGRARVVRYLKVGLAPSVYRKATANGPDWLRREIDHLVSKKRFRRTDVVRRDPHRRIPRDTTTQACRRRHGVGGSNRHDEHLTGRQCAVRRQVVCQLSDHREVIVAVPPVGQSHEGLIRDHGCGVQRSRDRGCAATRPAVLHAEPVGGLPARDLSRGCARRCWAWLSWRVTAFWVVRRRR